MHATPEQRAPLPESFYARGALRVARDLLGCVLVRRLGRQLLTGRIVETEAYVGMEDQACHARMGRTRRNAVMFGPPGHAYVYFIYGVHDMLNIVCAPAGRPEAVLVRAIEPVEGIAQMRKLRGLVRPTALASGPGKLCRAFAITRRHNGADLRVPPLWVTHGTLQRGERVARSARIGVEYAGKDADRAWRFYVVGNPNVSRARPVRPLRRT
jgi:DNA-3-methyladenine glycosylase